MNGPMRTRPIYLDHQATTPLDPDVLAAMLPYFTEQFGNPHSDDHEYGHQAASAVKDARVAVARLISASPGEIIFTSGATEANNLLLKGAARKIAQSGRPGIVTCVTEHNAVLEVVASLERSGHPVTYLPVDRDGLLDPTQVEQAIDAKTGLVSVMAVNNEIGTIQPIAALGSLCRRNGVLFHTDAAQAAGKIALDVRSMDIDLLSLSGHKMYGPKGIGAAFINRQTVGRLEALIDGGGQEAGMRGGTLPTPLCVALGEACTIAGGRLASESEALTRLRDRLLGALTRAGCAFTINGSLTMRWPGNLNLSFDGVDAEALILAVRDQLAIASGSACTSAALEPSYVVLALGHGLERAEGAIRIGIGRYTTTDEIDRAADKLVDAVQGLVHIASAFAATEG